MTVENEIVMVGGISRSTDQMFPTMKVIKIWPFSSSFSINSYSFSLFKVLDASLNEWTDDSPLWGGSVYDAIALPVPKKILKNCEFGPAA